MRKSLWKMIFHIWGQLYCFLSFSFVFLCPQESSLSLLWSKLLRVKQLWWWWSSSCKKRTIRYSYPEFWCVYQKKFQEQNWNELHLSFLTGKTLNFIIQLTYFETLLIDDLVSSKSLLFIIFVSISMFLVNWTLLCLRYWQYYILCLHCCVKQIGLFI